MLARQILPFDMKTVGRFFNLIGPFLAAVPVSLQITGVSDHSVLPTFRELVSEDPSKDYWVAWNDMGVDELMSVVRQPRVRQRPGRGVRAAPSRARR